MATHNKPHPNNHRNDLTAEFVRAIFKYVPETGDLIWISGYKNNRIGKIAGQIFDNGYRYIQINKKWYLAHRIVYLHQTGHWPPHELDHTFGNKLDNRFEKLRPCTDSQNTHNRKKQKNNTSGFKGVSFHKKSKKWRAQIMIDRKHHSLGLFNNPKEAHRAYCDAALALYKDFARFE
jgi:hypothetical protein